MASGEEEIGRGGQGAEEEKLSGPALWEMVAPVLAGSSVWNEDENPAGSAVNTDRQ
jgi:hypothetical protein